MVFLIVFGAVNFIRNPFALRLISAAGALILFLFGIKMSFSRKSGYTGRSWGASAAKYRTRRGQNLILSGLGISIANPYWSIWWLTAGLGIITASQKQGWLAIGIFFAGHILADLAWYSFVSFAVSKSGRFLPAGFVAALNRILGILLIGFALWLFWTCLWMK